MDQAEQERIQCYDVGFDPDLLQFFHYDNTCWQFLNFGVVDFYCGDPALLSGGRALFPEQMLVVLVVNVLLFRSAYYFVHAFIH